NTTTTVVRIAVARFGSTCDTPAFASSAVAAANTAERTAQKNHDTVHAPIKEENLVLIFDAERDRKQLPTIPLPNSSPLTPHFYTLTSHPGWYCRPHCFIASASLICPFAVSSVSSRFRFHAMFEICSIVTLTLATGIGECSGSPFWIPAMKFAKCASVIESRPMISLLWNRSLLATYSSVFFPSRS